MLLQRHGFSAPARQIRRPVAHERPLLHKVRVHGYRDGDCPHLTRLPMIRRFQERVLRVASRVVCHGRRLIFVVSEAATDWRRLWRHLQRVSWVPG